MSYFKDLIQQSASRAKQSSLSVLRISDAGLRQHLDQLLSAPVGEKNSFLAAPLFEHTFGWEKATRKMEDLKGELLEEELVSALDEKSNGRYRFGADWEPYKHQLESWEVLLNKEPKSIVVTSGTGSGKTECFMVPILNDLIKEHQENNEKLVGIRALFLYPLNALINSQQERLDAWTKSFGDHIRFSLYNGKTEEKKSKVRQRQKKHPNEILSRELLREEPAPILVTNGTMLEYMLVRQVDSPIIQTSRKNKSLRWIVLDEAHTYVGSQAAELSLLLRRVLQSFGVEAKDVRFVATSATIAGKGSQEKLKQYIASLAGVDIEQVLVIGGNRAVPSLQDIGDKNDPISSISLIDNGEGISQKRFDALCSSPIARGIRNALISADKPLLLREIVKTLDAYNLSKDDILDWLDLMTETLPQDSKEAFLRVRAHFFQQMINGFWSCIDPNCSCKQNTPLQKDWGFGYVYPYQQSKCDCGAPVFELSFCSECNEPHLLAADNGKLIQRSDVVIDEFSLQEEPSDEQEDDELQIPEKKVSYVEKVVISRSCSNNNDYELRPLDLSTHEMGKLTEQSIEVKCIPQDSSICSGCEFKGYKSASPFRRAILGAPFYVANVVPTLLEYCPDPEVDKITKLGPNTLPGRGRKLITFTDSRQGTARMAVRMQQEAERSRLRGLVFKILQNEQLRVSNIDHIPEEFSAEDLLEQASKLRQMGLDQQANEIEAKAQNMGDGTINFVSMTWQEMVKKLSERDDIGKAILAYNHYANPEVFDKNTGAVSTAELLLTREFARRPKRQNSLETLGIVSLGYQGLQDIKTIPEQWSENKLTLKDWHDFLKVTLDFYVRENSFIGLDDAWIKWIGAHFSPKRLLPPTSSEADENSLKKWRQYEEGQSNPHRLVKLLVKGSGIKLDTPSATDIINTWLKEAWKALSFSANSILTKKDNGFHLERNKITFSFIDSCYICPVTNKLLDVTFKNITPYLPRDYLSKDYKCKKIDFPSIWEIGDEQADFSDALKIVRESLAKDNKVTKLRSQNLWTDISDRTVEGGFYYRTAEHSAQQSAERLDSYEALFKEGKVNVLNCSTTMEMGVDIGGITAVAMNNVPPHPANYLQRAGRAGRSSESRAISYTLCKSNPHDNNVFCNPDWPFITTISAPSISLDSKRIVQRHVNSLLLSIFLKTEVGDTKKERTVLNLSWFFEGVNSSLTMCERFKSWVEINEEILSISVFTLVKGTILSNVSYDVVVAETIYSISNLEDSWVTEYESLNVQLDKATQDGPYKYRIEQEISRHKKEYLLKYLAAKSFLPGYGFPTDVVVFDNQNIEDFIRIKKQKELKNEAREDNISRLKDLPSRNLSIAIREYAPGSEIVIDGRVFESAGIALNWQKLGDPSAKESQKLDVAWRCDICGHTGVITHSVINSQNARCDNCNAQINEENKKQYIEPTGFVTEFYASVTNDVTHQKYIPVEKPWISVATAYHYLPNPLCGFMKYSHEGEVFYHSSGAGENGYAVCMSCGRAESMLVDNDFPKRLNPDSEHRPLRGNPKDDEKLPCDGSRILPNIHLGYSTITDVLELYIKNPIRNEFIPTNEEGHIVAYTLAVAVREALASELGVNATEMGYAVRPARFDDAKEQLLVIQLYDQTSGGSGFSTSAPENINKILHKAISLLHCVDHCESACASCLLSSDTRFDIDRLDRKLTLDWLGEDFKDRLVLPKEYHYFGTENDYCHHGLKETLQQNINRGVKKLVFWLSESIDDWDLAAIEFTSLVNKYLFKDQIEIDLVIPQVELPKDVKHHLWRIKSLWELSSSKINFITSDVLIKNGGFLVAQCLFIDERVITYATSSDDIITPSKNWLQSPTQLMLVSSSKEMNVQSKPLDISNWKLDSSLDSSTVVITLEKELNGSLDGFGSRFWALICDQHKAVGSLFDNDKIVSIEYTDRYLQSPWYILIITEILKASKFSGSISVTVKTFFKQARVGKFLYNDWREQEDFEQLFEAWSKQSSIDLNINYADSLQNISHARVMTLNWESKKKTSIIFDQGMGYWQSDFHYSDKSKRFYNFNKGVEDQARSFVDIFKCVKLKNSADWPTNITIINK